MDISLIVRVIRNVPIPQSNRTRLIDKFIDELKDQPGFDETRFRIMCTKDWND